MAREIGLAYSAVWDWLVRMHVGDLNRRFDRRSTGRKRMLTGAVLTYIKSWLNSNPQRYGLEAGSWQINMILEMVRKRFKIPVGCVRSGGCWGGWISHTRSRDRPLGKSASETEREEFQQETAGLLEEMSKQGCVVRVSEST